MRELLLEATTLPALLAATQRAARGKRHRYEVARFCMDAERHCLALQASLRLPVGAEGSWVPSASQQHTILDPKPRIISIIPFVDRVVHHALMGVVEERLERFAIHDSYACRKGKGQHPALARALSFSRRADYVLKGDIAAFFPSIRHAPLLMLLERMVPDPSWVSRIRQILRAGERAPGVGLPIGALTSQLLANFYLGILDHHVKDTLGCRYYVRYMDDFLVFGDLEMLKQLRGTLADFLQGRLELTLNVRSTAILPVSQGVPFLAARVTRRGLMLRPARWRRARAGLRASLARVAAGVGFEHEVEGLRSRMAYVQFYRTYRRRACELARHAGLKGSDRRRRQPCEPWRLLEEQPAERAGLEPQQEVPRQPQRQPGLSSFELITNEYPSAGHWGWPEAGGLRIVGACQGVDQVSVLVSVPLEYGPEAARPGGGPRSGMVTGPFFPPLSCVPESKGGSA